MSELAVVEEGVRIEIGEGCLDTDADIALAEAHAVLDKGERARAAGFVFARDRDRFVRAHGYLRRRLGRFLGTAPEAVMIVTPDGEKPFIEGGGASFSLSHSGSRVALAITRGADVGIDLETLERSDSLDGQMDGLARMCLTGEERGALAALPPERRSRRFLAYWTAKEARMKLTGEGMALEPRKIALRLSDGRPVGYRRPRAPRAGLRFVALSGPDTICCLAVRRRGDRLDA